MIIYAIDDGESLCSFFKTKELAEKKLEEYRANYYDQHWAYRSVVVEIEVKE